MQRVRACITNGMSAGLEKLTYKFVDKPAEVQAQEVLKQDVSPAGRTGGTCAVTSRMTPMARTPWADLVESSFEDQSSQAGFLDDDPREEGESSSRS